MGEFEKVAKVFVSPAEKLIDGIGKALGRVYEPLHLKRMADAQAYQVKKIGEALRENSDIPINYEKEGVSLSTSDYDEFVKRTQNRLAFQELRKQENIETVAGKALNLLEGKPQIEKEPVDVDWLVRFFNSVESIGNEEMQDLWAKLLAGEIQNSGTFSLRTMDKLCSISPKEAMVFQRLLNHTLRTNTKLFLLNDGDSKKMYSYDDVLLMNECGLINSTPLLSTKIQITFAFSFPILWSDNNVIMARAKEGQITISLPIYPLTQVGKELAQVVGLDMETQEMEEIASNLSKKNPKINFTVRKVMEHNGEQYSFEADEKELKEFESFLNINNNPEDGGSHDQL